MLIDHDQDKAHENLLARHGWTVECLRPFEIRHEESGSFATHLGAQAVISELIVDEFQKHPPKLIDATDVSAAFKKLIECSERADAIVLAAQSAQTPNSWAIAFDLLFADPVMGRANTIFSQLGVSFEFYDPDTDYEDDARAFQQALALRVDELRPFFA